MIENWIITTRRIATAVALLLTFDVSIAQQEEDLAKKLANPVANLISVPIQANFDDDFGADDSGSVMRINVQPVIPFEITDNWNVISRTIFPVLNHDNVPPGSSKFGLGDTVQSLFVSPKAPTSKGWIWGAGPVFLIPTATSRSLGSEKWGVGPTGVMLKQQGPWTYGFLANHIWSFAGESNRADINATFVQPFMVYVTKSQTSFALNTETTYDWEGSNWSVPINLTAFQMLKTGRQIYQLGFGIRYWLDSPDTGPEGWGVRLQLTLLFPQ